jgi:hypothetical protein
MGEHRVSIRTLPSGERVEHHPPTEQFPEGQMFLIRDHSPLRRKLDGMLAHHQDRHAQLHAHNRRLLERKWRRLDRGGVPHEKRCV